MHDAVTILKTTESYTFSGWIVWYLSYILIKLLQKKKRRNMKFIFQRFEGSEKHHGESRQIDFTDSWPLNLCGWCGLKRPRSHAVFSGSCSHTYCDPFSKPKTRTQNITKPFFFFLICGCIYTRCLVERWKSDSLTQVGPYTGQRRCIQRRRHLSGLPWIK